MFTGIVQSSGQIIKIVKSVNFQRYAVIFPRKILAELALGASVAHNGCCLTVTSIDDNIVWFDLMQVTLALTNLGQLKVGERINVERAAKFGDEIGGHCMSGHITCMADIVEVIKTESAYQIWIEVPSNTTKYVLEKGYIGIDGISLTIGKIKKNHFCVNLIPETLQRTNIGRRQVGDKLNIEIDPQTQAVVDTVERVLAVKN
ncbi:riboflavin synthase subunit alpha [Candidatus Enterovibrio altilux]|uniref:Riboflavin synthase n=1 Tax=Candidatus Enterovibrio altilux TaxID=1927128 RepID=A0A291BBD6_9GAMM|nr:riboflavin synthase subunit alpha [Candidatus Enterovibrio luxaltus]ATF10320.1 Riboflavin synthase eubacterial/eukaryotic [Candidatus Enterovibrio luxaltus]